MHSLSLMNKVIIVIKNEYLMWQMFFFNLSPCNRRNAANPLLNFSSISVIPNVNRLSANGVDETLMTTVGGFSPSDRQSLLPHVDRIERLDIREAKLAGPFLDGCNVSSVVNLPVKYIRFGVDINLANTMLPINKT